MLRFQFFILLLAVIPFSAFSQPTSPTGKIKIIVTDLKNTDGFIHVSLFNSPEGFPSDEKAPLISRKLQVLHQSLEFTFDNIPFGFYAISVMHDENANNEIDTNFIGIPKEGVGVSNNALRTFGPPRFEDSKFELDQNEIVLTIKLHYY